MKAVPFRLQKVVLRPGRHRRTRDVPAATTHRRFDEGSTVVESTNSYAVFAWESWWVTVEFGPVDNRFRPVRIEMRGYANKSDQEAVSISAVDLRRLPLGTITQAALAALREEAEAQHELAQGNASQSGAIRWEWDEIEEGLSVDSQAIEDKITLDESRFVLAELREPTKRGRRRNDEQLKLTAKVYRQALKRGMPPTLAVKEKFDLTEAGARKRVQRARKAGHLRPTKQGIAGG